MNDKASEALRSAQELCAFLKANAGGADANIEIKATWQHGESLARLLEETERLIEAAQ
jgi:hypothetical protein